jgi:hypothetical protein
MRPISNEKCEMIVNAKHRGEKEIAILKWITRDKPQCDYYRLAAIESHRNGRAKR